MIERDPKIVNSAVSRPWRRTRSLWRALSRSRILLVNPAALNDRLRKINHLGPSTWARNPPKMACSWRVWQCRSKGRYSPHICTLPPQRCVSASAMAAPRS